MHDLGAADKPIRNHLASQLKTDVACALVNAKSLP